MRELKFRAWHPDQKKMVYSDNLGIYFDHTIYPYQNWVIEQFVGIKDKNGKDVFEGDVVIWPHLDSDGKHEIYFEINELQYSARPLTDHNDIDLCLDSTHMEIISHILQE